MQPNPAVVETEPKPNRTPYILLAAGCGVLFLVSLCCIPGALYYAKLSAEPAVFEEYEPAEPRVIAPPAPPPSPVSATDPSVPAMRTVRVQITHVEGLSTPAVGSECRFAVERRARRDGTFWCHTVVACGGPSLFGNERQGFFNCTLYEGVQRHVVGDDPQTSRVDRDAAFHLDTLNAEFEVRDDATGPLGQYLLRGRVLGVD